MVDTQDKNDVPQYYLYILVESFEDIVKKYKNTLKLVQSLYTMVCSTLAFQQHITVFSA
jgi:hypothetical protein